MKAIVLKPIMWNTKNYAMPSGYPCQSGYPSENGFGHEEWNNKPNRIWKNYKLFHTESTEKLKTYSETGELGMVMISSFKSAQFAIGIATSVYHIDEDEMVLIANTLKMHDEWKEAWALDAVKMRFNGNEKNFLNFWAKNYKWIQWKCPIKQYHHFNDPIKLDPQKISGKNRLITMFGRYQPIYPEQAISIIENELPKSHPIISWLSESDFNDDIIANDLKRFRKEQKQ